MIYAVHLPRFDVFSAWREAARCAISHGIAPDNMIWHEADAEENTLFPASALPDKVGSETVRVPTAYLQLARSVIWHSAPERFNLLYTVLWRILRRDGDPLSPADALGHRLSRMAKSVGRDIHKMHAFVRFRELPHDGTRRRFMAWFEPEHNTLEPGSVFFVKRFADMDWSILTPKLCVHFRNGSTTFSAGCVRPDLPDDASEALWATYFSNIFNPARIKLNAMRAEMPKKYWKNMPETRLIPDMLMDAEDRVKRMLEAGASTPRKGAAVISTRYRAGMKNPD